MMSRLWWPESHNPLYDRLGTVQVTISRLVQWVKGKTSYKLLQEFPHLKKRFWAQHLWVRGGLLL